MVQIIEHTLNRPKDWDQWQWQLTEVQSFCSSLQTGGKGNISKALGTEQINILISNNLQPHKAT